MGELGHYIPAVIWTVAGIIGLVVRLLLFAKFYTDLLYVRRTKLGSVAERIARREIDSCTIHLMIKGGIVSVGMVALVQRPVSSAAEGTDLLYAITVTVVLLAIPWLLVFDSIREYRHQISMLNLTDEEITGANGSVHQRKYSPDGRPDSEGDPGSTAAGH